MPPDPAPSGVRIQGSDPALSDVATGSKLSRRQLPQRAVGPMVIVVLSPSIQGPLRVLEIEEPVTGRHSLYNEIDSVTKIPTCLWSVVYEPNLTDSGRLTPPARGVPVGQRGYVTEWVSPERSGKSSGCTERAQCLGTILADYSYRIETDGPYILARCRRANPARAGDAKPRG